MKKTLCIILSLALLLCFFTACGNSEQTGAENGEAETAQTAAQEDGQNPVMNFIGKYDNGGTYITVDADGANGAKFTVEWPLTDDEKETYTFSGEFDSDKLTVAYTNSTKTVCTLGAGGKTISEKTAYTDGSGTIQFAENGTLQWLDQNEAQRLTGNETFQYCLTTAAED